MGRRRGFLAILVALVAAIFTIQTMQVVSSPVEVRQTARDAKSDGANAEKLLADNDCRSCHAADRTVVGPSYSDIAKRYAGQGDATEKLAHSIRQGGSGNWGSVAMTSHPDLKDDQLAQIVSWILSLNDVGAAPAQEATQYKYNRND